jgi:molybdate transport system permease protein
MPDDLTPLWISLKTAVVATLFAALLGIACARWMLHYRGRSRGLIDGILTLPLVLPPTVVGFLLLLLLGRNGPIGRVLNPLGISLIFTWAAVVIAATVVAFPLMYKTVLSAFEQVDSTLIQSAQTLGASEWRIFWQILLPLAWPGLLAGTVLAFARALGEFGATLMVGGSIPGVTQTIPIAIFFAAEAGRMEVALVWVLLMVGVSLLVISGLNNGGRRKPTRPTLGQGMTQRGFNWVFFRRFKAPLFSSRLPLLCHIDPASTPGPQTGSLLTVAIEKQLPGFHLKVDIQTHRAPLGILGSSGSGKSMTLRCIAGLETPSQGRIVLNGRVLFDADAGINLPCRDRRVGLVFQTYALFPHLTVAQNIAFGMTHLPPHHRGAAVLAYLDRVALSGLGDRYPHQLSGGQQQRVALARAIATQPEVLLLDEPLSALDPYLRYQLETLLVDLLGEYEGITLFITHKLEEAYRLCPNLMVLSQGQVQAYGAKQDIVHRPPTLNVARITECKNLARARPLDNSHLDVLDWACQLWLPTSLSASVNHVGLRAHHVQFPPTLDDPNTFPGWVAMSLETQHRVTLYIKLHQPPTCPQDYHLQAEVYRDQWQTLSSRPCPWPIQLPPNALMPIAEP